jgi:hypothetical protein
MFVALEKPDETWEGFRRSKRCIALTICTLKIESETHFSPLSEKTAVLFSA